MSDWNYEGEGVRIEKWKRKRYISISLTGLWDIRAYS